VRLVSIGAIVLTLTTLPAQAQLQVAIISGVVADARGRPVIGAVVALTDPSGTTVAATTSGPGGTFRIADIVPGAYTVRVDVGGVVVLASPMVVRGALPIELMLTTGSIVQEEVVVRGDASSNAAEHPVTVAGEAVRRSAEPIPSQRVQAALASLPGWSAEDNGLLHIRGVDDGLLYVQDGIPVYERLDRLFGLPPSPTAIDSLHVMDGYVPPEFGFKSGAVIIARSTSGLRGAWNGTLDAGFADFDTRHVQGMAAGPLGQTGALMVTASDERSEHFLDPVDLDNFHNKGSSTSAAAQFTWVKGTHQVTTSVQGGGDRYDVPNTIEQEEAGQDQRQHTDQLIYSGSWQQVRSDRTVWQLSTYSRHGSGRLLPSDLDFPVTADTERINKRFGALSSLNHQRGDHAMKVGGEASVLLLDERFSFAVTDEEEAKEAGLSEEVLEHDVDNPFTFADHQRPWLLSLYGQDAYRASDRLTVNFGARFDLSRQLVHAWHLSPRLGVAYQARPGSTVRASVQQFFQPPQAEYLLLSSSEEARELSPFVDEPGIGGGLSIPPGRQTAIDASFSQELRRGWTLDATGWWRRGRDVGDPNVFVGTTIVFPNSVARQHASGLT
jgi:hypothetical protein